MSQRTKILNVGRNICSSLVGQNCLKIINVGRNICSSVPCKLNLSSTAPSSTGTLQTTVMVRNKNNTAYKKAIFNVSAPGSVVANTLANGSIIFFDNPYSSFLIYSGNQEGTSFAQNDIVQFEFNHPVITDRFNRFTDYKATVINFLPDSTTQVSDSTNQVLLIECLPQNDCIKINDVRKTPLVWDVGIQTTAANQTFGIQINGTNPNITVDWGNGLVETFTTTGNKTRTYATAGNYTVKISGSFSANGNISLGTINSERARVISTSEIPTIPGLANFDSTFEFCSSLNSIPATLFANNTAVTSFNRSFYSCDSLNSIPATLFANNTAVTSFNDSFYSCDSLNSIPATLFANNTAVTSFNGTFANCINITTIPTDLFTNNTGVTNFVFTFTFCTSLATVPATLFANNTAVTSFINIFNGCSFTTSSYSNLLINMASNAASRLNNVIFNGGNSRYTLAGQTAKQTLEAKGWVFTDLGLDNTAPTTWDVGIQTTAANQTFSIQINGTSPNITVDWGDGTIETFTTIGSKTRTYALAGNYTVKISGSFGANGNIRLGTTTSESARVQSTSVIPTIPGLANFEQTFRDCASLTSIPAGLFDNNTAVTSFGGTFFGCTSLTSIPAGLFDNNTAVTDFSNVFEGVSLTTTSYSNLLINMASNAASRQNNVPFHGGNSRYNLSAAAWRQILTNKGWVISDNGLDT